MRETILVVARVRTNPTDQPSSYCRWHRGSADGDDGVQTSMTKRMKSLNVWALTLAMMGVAPLAAQQAPPPPPPAAQATPSGQIEVVQAQYIPGQAKPPDT